MPSNSPPFELPAETPWAVERQDYLAREAERKRRLEEEERRNKEKELLRVAKEEEQRRINERKRKEAERLAKEESERKDRERRQLERDQEASKENIRRLRNLIRDKYRLDIEVWSQRNCIKMDRDIVLKKGLVSDEIFQEIVYVRTPMSSRGQGIHASSTGVSCPPIQSVLDF